MSVPSTVIGHLNEIGLSGRDFQKSDDKSVRGPCMSCGGSRRFVVFIDKDWPSWYGFCDICGKEGWADQLNPNLKTGGMPENTPPPANLDAAPDGKDSLALLDDFRREKPWEQFHDNLDEKSREWWRQQGIPDKWQDIWKLGYLPEKFFKVGDELRSCPAYTIPKFGLGWTAMNIDYRLKEPPEKGGKYRPKYGLDQFPFLSDPDNKDFFLGDLLIVEGSKKAMVTRISQSIFDCVAGVPACNSWGNIEKYAKRAERAYVVLDPRADIWAARLCKEIGEHAKFFVLPTKIDDAFLYYGMTEDHLIDAINWSRGVY